MTALKINASAPLLAMVALAIVSCAAPEAAKPPARSWQPIGEQLIELDGRLRQTPFRVLLGFETESDLAFLAGVDRAKRDESIVHTGPGAVALPDGTQSFAVKLSSLLPSASFPGTWTLVGAYLHARSATVVKISYEVNGKTLVERSVALSANRWSPAMLDLSPLADPNVPPPPPPGMLRFTFSHGATGVVLDDVMLVNNTQTLVSGDLSGDGWTVRVRGFKTFLERTGHFSVAVHTPDGVNDAWQLVEANEMRVRFIAPATGALAGREWTIYADGRAYLNGKFEPVEEFAPAMKAALVEQHESPAEMAVPEEMGRVDRNAPGDLNNDGYAEQTGAYQLKANGPRVVVTLRPRSGKLIKPMLEIAGLPDGKVTGNLEGVLIQKSVRLADKHVLVELPGTIERGVTVELKVQ